MASTGLRRFIRATGLVLLVCARARVLALAQWERPYDPDLGGQQESPREEPRPTVEAEPSPLPFPPEPRIVFSTAPIAVSTETVDLPSWIREAGPFLLLERPDPSRIFDVLASTEPIDFAEFAGRLKPFQVGQKRWNQMRSDVETGRLPTEEIEIPILPLPPDELFLSTEAPRPPPPEVELPAYGTSLSVTGRKLVGFQFSEKRFLRDQTTTGRPKSINLIDITQQLQLRMQGKVGPKITVNVDYDDTKTNKQDISVVYTGDPNEVVQNASFGDIDLSLPATEFVSYNKQLFGIRADLKYKGFRGHFIGSRTKGVTKTKRFNGNSQFAQIDIPDTSYIRRTYYDLSFGSTTRLPITAGSERIFLDRQQNPPPANSVDLVVDDLGVTGSTYTGKFVQLSPGTDYTIDYVKGILTFRTPLAAQYVLAADFITPDGNIINQTTITVNGGTGRFKLLKTNADVPIAQSTSTAVHETGFRRELKTIYSVGANQIVRDDGRGNFIWKVLDPTTREDVGTTLNPLQKYPDTVEVDFENGTFRLLSPFGLSASTPTPDPQIYDTQAPISKRLIHVEYNFRLRTFFLEPNLVIQSEIVLVDAVRLNRNVDYFIDYESGFITFFNEDRVRRDSIIDVSYEVAPFAGLASESILGTRVSHEWRKWNVGSTVLYQSGTKSPTVPSVTELAKSLLILEVDTQFKDIRLWRGFKGTFQGEYARSIQRPNLHDHALIDNMEGVKQEESAGIISAQWQIAANPNGIPSDPRMQALQNEDIKVLDINPKATAGANETQKVLNFNYDFAVDIQTTSIVFVFSPTGVDMSQKSILEVTLLGDNSNNEINFTLGGINEDADGDALLDTEDVNSDGILQASEDIGFLYNPAGKQSARFGATNGKIDSEDLNKNLALNSADLTGDSFGYDAPTSTGTQLFDVTSGSTRTRLDFTGWHTFQVPLNISTATFSRWTSIKELRVSLRRGPASTKDISVVKFARIAAVGNSWALGRAGDPSDGSGPKGAETITVTAVNNADNPGYTPIFTAGGDAQSIFDDLYGSTSELQKTSGSKQIQEQALELRWRDLEAGATVHTKRTFARSIDISQHKRFSFLLFGNPDPNNLNQTGEKVFFLRAGSDKDFHEVRVPITFTGWRRISLDQNDLNGDQIPDEWRLDSGPAGTVVLSTGAPRFQQIASLVAGVYSTGATVPNQGALWLNEIHLSEPIQRLGAAQKLQMDFTVDNWATFGAKYRFVDRHYQTPTTTLSNQDNRQDTSYLNLTRLGWLPMNFTLGRTITDTPNPNATGNLSNTVNLLQAGKVVKWDGTANGNLAYGAYPRLSLGYVRSRTEYDLLTRLDDRNTYNSALSYAVPIQSRFAPRTIDLNYSFSRYQVGFESLASRLIPGNVDTDERTNTIGGRLSFAPWTGSSLNPNYSLTLVDESRNELRAVGVEKRNKYPKSLNQTAGLSANFRLLSWLNPSLNYSINNIENNLLTASTFVVTGSTFVFDIGDIKTVNRTANASIGLPLNVVDIFPRTRLFRTFNLANSYQLQDGDVWTNIEKEVDTKLSLWVRTPLKPASPVAQRTSLTLRDTMSSTQRWSPLEAYDIRGRKASFKSLALSNNFVQSIQRTETTGTPSRTIATTLPDIVASMGGLEKLLWSERWMENGQVNLKYAAHETETVGVSLDEDASIGTDLRAIVRKRFDTAISLNLRDTQRKDLRLGIVTQTTHHEDATVQSTFDIRFFRFTPKVDYAFDFTKDGNGVQSANVRVVTPSLLIRADLALPRGLVLPFTGKTLLFTNRVIWTNNLSFAIRSSPVTQADNSKLLTYTTSGDYEIAKNLRMTLNGGFSRLWHRFLKEEDFISYNFGLTLTFQF